MTPTMQSSTDRSTEPRPELQQLIESARARIAEVVATGQPVALQFSGGKDALAVLHLARPWWDRITVVWGNPGDEFPETREQMERVRELVPFFVEIRGDSAGMQRRLGWPVDLLPMWATPMGQMMMPEGGSPALVAVLDCCARNLWLPMHQALLQAGIKHLLRGQRDDERRRNSNYQDGATDPQTGMQVVLPIQGWTEADVFEFLAHEGVEIPRQYGLGLNSLDCLHCTAYLDEKTQMLRYLRRHHPAAAVEVERRLVLIDGEQERQRSALKRALLAPDTPVEAAEDQP